MIPRTFAITAASGRIGSRVARGLLHAGHRVRVLGRDPVRLQPLVDLGAAPHVGDTRDPAFLAQAFRGADSALLVVRADRTSRHFRRDFGDLGHAFADAARASALPAALFVSCTGAHDDRHRGLVVVHRDVELELARVPSLAVTSLRAPFFLENLLYFLPAMKAANAARVPLDPDAAFDAGSTEDVARVALELLLAPAAGPRVHEIRRRDPVTMRSIAAALSELLGRPFPVERMPRAANVDAMIAAGATPDFAHLMNDAWDTFSRYGLLRAADADFTLVTTPVDDYLRAAIVAALAGAHPFGSLDRRQDMTTQKHMRLEYRLRDEIDPATYEPQLEQFVANMRSHARSHDYAAYRDPKDSRHFVHVGHFLPDDVKAMQKEPWFDAYTTKLRTLTVRPPDVTMLELVASTRS